MGMMLRRYHVEETPALAYPDGDPSESWTKEQLVAWATARGFDLTGTKTKADILSVIAAGHAAPDVPAEPGNPAEGDQGDGGAHEGVQDSPAGDAGDTADNQDMNA